MSESILNALMHLFAVIATLTDESISSSARQVVKSYLLQHLKENVAEEYLSLFDDYVDFYRRDQQLQQSGDVPDTSINNSEYLAKVCDKIKKELHRNERIIVLLRLLEFVYEDHFISEEEEEFIRLVAETFSINQKELDNAMVFVTGGANEEYDPDHVLFISTEEKSSIDELEGDWIEKNRPRVENKIKKIIKPGLSGQITILHFSNINIYALKYDGQTELHLDGYPVEQGIFYILSTGSIIRSEQIGSIYYSEIASQFLKPDSEINVVLTGNNIEFRFKNSENGIHSFSFYTESGELAGIMGGSGVGKSTLLNLLSGQLKPDSGSITLNDYDLYHDKFKLKGILGFVPQDDLLFEELTVFQNLYYNARLCFGDFNESKLIDVVNRVLDDLKLQEIKDLKVGNPIDKFVSGGQRKRLNIGLELMREPAVLFVDEPTSGLSSTDSVNVMRLLKEQAIKGKLVIANIHQPSSSIFKMFDKLWVLDQGGFPIYSGNPVDAIVYFKKLSSFADISEAECPTCGFVNPDQILEIIEARKVDDQGAYTNIRKIQPEEWFKHYKAEIEPKSETKPARKILPRSHFKLPDIDKQFFIFLTRNIKSKLANRQYILINLFEAPVLAFILAWFIKYIEGNTYIFSENKNLPTYIFMSIIVALFLGLVVSAEEIIKDRKILKREEFLNLSRFSYLNSKIVYLFIVSAIQTFLFVLVGNLILEIKGMLFIYWLVLFSTTCFANMVGLNISAGLNSVVTIYILIPIILIPQLLLSGVPVKFDDLNKSLTLRKYVPVIGDLMTSRWAYEALAVDQFKNNKFEAYFYDTDQSISDASFSTSFLIPRLINVLEECRRNFDNPGYEHILSNNLELLKNEFHEMGSYPEMFPFEYAENLTIEGFDEDLAEEAYGYLTYIRLRFNEMSSQASARRDSIYKSLADSMGEDAILQLKLDYHNDHLSDFVTNRLEINKIIQVGNELVRKKDPIFMLPESNFGRAQFYAPVKKFNNQLYDTKWFNLIVIWGFSFFLYITLLLDVLRKFIDYFDTAKLRRKG